MSIARASVLSGPGTMAFNSATLFPKGDMESALGISTWQPESSMHGQLDQRVDDRFGRASITPVGQLNAAIIAALWPYRTTLIGASIFGADSPLVVHSLGGIKHTWPAAAITKMPELFFGAKLTALGQVQFTCIGKDNTEWDTADSILKIETEAFPDLTWAEFDHTDVITEPATISWATGGGGTAFKTESGATASFEMSTSSLSPDETGLLDMRLEDVGVMLKFTPLGKTELEMVNMLKAQGVGNLRRGARLATVAYDITISNSLLSLVIPKAALVEEGFKWGRTALRHGEVGFVATRNFTGGKRDALWTMTLL